MTVRQLILELSNYSQDMEVEYECEGGRTLHINNIYTSDEHNNLLILGTY